MKVSLVITTYNWKEALDMTLRTVFSQTRLPDEVIVADDGSREDTVAMIREKQAKSPIPLIHSWQPDEGFRVAASRNKAIAKARFEYIILTDGDLLLHPQFCEDHIRNAERGYWLQGTRTNLDRVKTEEIFRTGNTRITCWSRGVERRKNAIHSPLLGKIFTGNKRSVNGSNLSFWRDDAIAVNGFNEAFVGWGAEDVEFIARITHSGIRRRNIRFQALTFHLYHNERSGKMLPHNQALLDQTIQTKATRCEKGLDAHFAEIADNVNTADVV